MDRMVKKGTTAPAKQQEYQIKPKNKEKFKPSKAKEIIGKILDKKLVEAYLADKGQHLIKEIAELIKTDLKALNLPRYKYVVQVFIGDQKGQGVRIGGRCFWDNDTDLSLIHI
eukprot:TRINITY_DN7694_c0_g1_i1.p1 TRINITY_DN7694_c0_g1~~TRINITY_DN7694_c0_g1_i1.p1  ORF type:complete len:113 (-),score=28.80 TRINITY_DN7694_c0_g1_i1:60-398(-)